MAQAVAGLKADYMKQLGARGLTDQDMKILGEALPRIDSDPQARVDVARILRKEHELAIDEYLYIVDQENRDYPNNRFKRPRWVESYRSQATGAPAAKTGGSFSSLWGDEE